MTGIPASTLAQIAWLVKILLVALPVGFFGLLGLALLLSGASRLSTWVRLERSSADVVTDTGFQEIEGTAKPLDGTLDPPRADAESLAYEYTRKKRVRGSSTDGSRSRWRTEAERRDSVPFVIETGASEAVVDPDGANFNFEAEREEEGATSHVSERLDVGDEVYVAGESVPAHRSDVETTRSHVVQDAGDSFASFDRSSLFATPFFLSDASEGEAEGRLLAEGLKQLLGGGIVVGFIVLGLTLTVLS